jgi:hypothetical protein
MKIAKCIKERKLVPSPATGWEPGLLEIKPFSSQVCDLRKNLCMNWFVSGEWFFLRKEYSGLCPYIYLFSSVGNIDQLL